ncbi:hypothetical protein BpHYR1_034083 [Brachionus plicatilis]|uniref:Uncharacterized protein n=1 Tax=Brachionus plicatilis TaxID=10195 RepID=A0A3M7QTP2_BRAPC|nr:hypothetical protein BpHYR1_034083 [Brachionus plicatilis]
MQKIIFQINKKIVFTIQKNKLKHFHSSPAISKTNIKNIQIIQNNAFRSIFKKPKFTRITTLNDLSKVNMAHSMNTYDLQTPETCPSKRYFATSKRKT